jgi:hypothetical protein
MMPGGHLAHSGTRMIEFIEDPLNDVWEISLANQALYFTGLVRITTGLGGHPTRIIITHETIEIILPLQRLYLALQDMGIAPSGPIGPEPQEPFVSHVEDPAGVAENGTGGGIVAEEEDPDEELEDGEFIGEDPNGHV